MGSALGQATASFDHKGEITDGEGQALKYPKFSFEAAFRIGDTFSTEAGVGGSTPIYSASFDTVADQQDYDLQSLLSASSLTDTGEAYFGRIEDKRIIVLVPNTNVENGWRRNIFDINKGDAQCTGNTFFNELNELNDKSDNTEKINKKVNKIINKYYDFYGYREFANKIDRIIKENININPLKPGDDIEQWKEQINLKRRNVIKELFSNKLIIVDEVHNLRSTEKNEEKKESLRRLEEIAENTDNLKLVLLSATPMFDNKNEIEWLINLLLRNDKR